MPQWKVSHYTAVFPGADGELLLCNSFMGAMTVVGVNHRDMVLDSIANGIQEVTPSIPLKMLCEHGYFVEDRIDEVPLVQAVMDRERDSSGFELIVMPHENCNFRCVYCYEKFERGRMKAEVVVGLKGLVDRQAGEWGRVHISWFGGEPLLASDVITDLSDAFLASTQRHGVKYSSAMTTNGYFLTPAVADAMLSRGVKFYQITVDGPEHEHNARRHLAGGGASYRRVFDNLIALHERDDQIHGETPGQL